MKKLSSLSACTAIALSLALPVAAQAASFTVNDGQSVTTSQTLTAGETGIINSGGTLAVNANNTNTINSSGSGVVILNNGTLSAAGATTNGPNAGAFAINNSGANATITNNGAINTTGFNDEGINTTGANSTITNNGTISTTATFAEGIVGEVGSTSANITNNGTITIGGTANGIYTIGNSSIITNNGTITTANGSTLVNTGTSGTITNSKSVSATNGYGIQNTGSSATVTNSGTITTFGNNSDGILSSGTNSTATNRGTITTTDAISTGMHGQATGITLTNYGTIVSNGPAMRTNSTNNTLTNYGTISTSGTNSEGLIAANNNNTLINNGTITVTSLNSDGLGSDAGTSGQTFVNNGTINVSGTGASGIANYSSGSTIRHNGVINTGGAATRGIYSSVNNSTDTTLILGANSQTNGTITFGGANNLLQYDVSGAGRAGSVAIVTGTITGTHTASIINTNLLTDGAKVVQSGNNVAVVTPDNFANSQATVNQTVTQTADIINQRQLALLTGGSVSGVASGEGMGRTAWVEGFGSYQERGADQQSDASEATSGGFLAGVDYAANSNGVKRGFYVGGFAGNLDVGNFREVDSIGALAGGYAGKQYGKYYVSGQMALGYSANESDRVVGLGIASADYNSLFFSPSVTVMRPFEGGKVTWVPSATLRYTGQFDESYTETGSLANQSVDSRYSSTIAARAMMEAKFDEKRYNNSTLNTSLRAGVEAETAIGNEVDLTVLSTNVSFDPKGADDNIDGIVGANVAYTLGSGLNLYLDGEANIGLNHGNVSDNLGGTGRLGARWNF